ncbi:MAG TPA: hypothetical protein VGM05_02650 [Planctomycetaceae bacterium]|jgi:hypothetical protein
MRYELWEYENGHTFFEVAGDEAAHDAQVRQLKLDEPQARLAWTVEAGSWNEASQFLYDRKGWGRYRTLEEDEERVNPPAANSDAPSESN